MTKTEAKERILEVLPFGSDHPVTASRICVLTGLRHTYTEVELRRIIREMIAAGYPIGALKNGYFRVREKKDLDAVGKNLKSRAKGNVDRFDDVKQGVFEDAVQEALPTAEEGAQTEKQILRKVKEKNVKKVSFFEVLLSLMRKGNSIIILPGRATRYFQTTDRERIRSEVDRIRSGVASPLSSRHRNALIKSMIRV